MFIQSTVLVLLSVVLVMNCCGLCLAEKPWDNGRLVVSENGRFLQHENGKPFFWQGDTAWLLFAKLTRSETQTYLDSRKAEGFNVIQVMVLHEVPQFNVYGDSALFSDDPTQPLTTPGIDPEVESEYDYWDHVDYIVDQAADRGIYVAMIPAWGSVIEGDSINIGNIRVYTEWLVKRYRNKSNIIWLNGGDAKGDSNTEIWKKLGMTLRATDPNHLITYHPFGRTQSSIWFHNEPWLDFNMFQSGHRRYDQLKPGDNPKTWKGEDNYKYVLEDYAKSPPKPTIDGEPSYENIPQGLHDPNEPYWQAADVRRYAYWSVFAGAFGHTYGNNAVMQMYKPDSGRGAYGPRNYWYEAIDDPGGEQMQYLKALILSRPFFERIFDSSLIAGKNGTRYNYIIATRGSSYAFLYTYTGRTLAVSMGKISGKKIKAWWYSPRDGKAELLSEFDNKGVHSFDPPGDERSGNDWVLVLDDSSMGYPEPGSKLE